MSDPFCRKCRQPLGGRHVPDCIWEDQVVPSECDGVIEEAMATVKARKSAEAIARLRTLLETPAYVDAPLGVVDLFAADLRALLDALAELEVFGRKVSAIRDSIVGSQQFNWSEHAYPLVAALGEAGFNGAGHEIASKNFGTLLDRLEKAEAERDEAKEALDEFNTRRDGTPATLAEGIQAMRARLIEYRLEANALEAERDALRRETVAGR